MADTQIIERSPTSTTIRTGSNGQKTVLPNVIPILPIRNIVVFPGTVMPLNVGRAKSKALLDEVMPGDKLVGVCTQRNADVEDPGYADLHTVGVACTILKLFKLPDGNQSIIVHGLTRFRLLEVVQTEPFATGRIEVLEDVLTPGPSLDALVASVRQQANRVIELSPNTPDEAAQVLNSITQPSALADFLAANLPIERGDITEKQLMLEELDVEKRLRLIAARLATQLDVLELQSKIQSQVKENIDKSQRRYYLQEQMKAIRKELGEGEGRRRVRGRHAARKAHRRQAPRAGDEGGQPRTGPAGVDPQRQPGVRRHPHLAADRQRAALVDRHHRQDRPGRRPRRSSTATTSTWTR